MQKFTIVAVLVAVLGQASAICPGFNYGIGEQEVLGNGISRWNVYDDSCNVVDGLTTSGNPCTQNIFGCSPPPILFDEYTNTFTGLRYACRTDPNSGVCNGNTISVCCRNDGN